MRPRRASGTGFGWAPLSILALLLAACTPALEYPPPPQKAMPAGPDPLPSVTLLNMGVADADSGILQDVLGLSTGANWRWTGQHPRCKVWFEPGLKWNFYTRFNLAEVVRKAVGPITVRMIVNDQVLDTAKFDQAREYKYSKPIPPGMLTEPDSAVIGFDVDPVYVSRGDGVKLGVLLNEIGLKPADSQ